MSKTAWIIFSVIAAGLLGGLVYFASQGRVNVDTVDVSKIQPATEQAGNIGDHVFGKADSKVMLLEYGDYQCPGCKSAFPTVKAITEKYQGQIAFVFRSFPIASLHPNARAASAAAEAAGLQGKYWEMHNLLYENQAAWQDKSTTERGAFFTQYAKQLALNDAKFESDMGSSQVNQKISFDQAIGKKAGVNATPSFYLNGKAIDLYVKDGQLVDQSVQGSSPIWGDQAAFEKYVILPALKNNNIIAPADV